MNNVSPLVVLVDDDAAVRTAVARLIISAGYRVEAFDSARAFLERGHHSVNAACLVLDARLPEISGLDLQEELKAAHSMLPIIFISGQGDIPMSVRAMKAGAADFLTKPFHDTELLSAIEKAITRGASDVAEKAQRDAIQERADSLTPREREVMDFVVAGLLNKQIAGRLGIAEKTIKVHRARVMGKMQAKSLADLVRMVEKASASRPN